jgi:hypothetical protein
MGKSLLTGWGPPCACAADVTNTRDQVCNQMSSADGNLAVERLIRLLNEVVAKVCYSRSKRAPAIAATGPD